MSRSVRIILLVIGAYHCAAFSMFGPAIQHGQEGVGFGRESIEYKRGLQSGNIYGRRDSFLKTMYSAELPSGTKVVITYYKTGKNEGDYSLSVSSPDEYNRRRAIERIENQGFEEYFKEAAEKFEKRPLME